MKWKLDKNSSRFSLEKSFNIIYNGIQVDIDLQGPIGVRTNP
jgi:hypothetical protein